MTVVGAWSVGLIIFLLALIYSCWESALLVFVHASWSLFLADCFSSGQKRSFEQVHHTIQSLFLLLVFSAFPWKMILEIHVLSQHKLRQFLCGLKVSILGCEVFSLRSEVPNPFLSGPKLWSKFRTTESSVSLLFRIVEELFNDATSPTTMRDRTLCSVSPYLSQHGSNWTSELQHACRMRSIFTSMTWALQDRCPWWTPLGAQQGTTQRKSVDVTVCLS